MVLAASLVEITGSEVASEGGGAGAFFFGLAADDFLVMLQGGLRMSM